MEKVTTRTIINTMSEWVEEKQPISPGKWVEAAAKLNLLIGDENELLYKLESEIAKKKLQVMCANCNQIKQREREEFSWKLEIGKENSKPWK